MSINSTNHIIDPKKAFLRELGMAIHSYEARKYAKHFHNWKITKCLKKCSQCKGNMRSDLAKLQIENNRENAPICMACIMGYKRKIKIKNDSFS